MFRQQDDKEGKNSCFKGYERIWIVFINWYAHISDMFQGSSLSTHWVFTIGS